jgi:5S rRNA maturation endonuclease (ribonuclease M5)/ABC-type transport system involved in cytochrome c biogenesis ATPase subunit
VEAAARRAGLREREAEEARPVEGKLARLRGRLGGWVGLTRTKLLAIVGRQPNGNTMQLKSFEIRNYRSIDHARIDNVGDVTTLIGPNNEGKSNILRALRLGLSTIEDIQRYRVRRPSTGSQNALRLAARGFGELDFDWRVDAPIKKRNKDETVTSIKMTFDLSEKEIEDFQELFGIKVNGKIPVLVEHSRNQRSVKIPKQGPSSDAFQEKLAEIARFVSSRISFFYIPAIRTAESAQEILERLINKRVRAAQEGIIERIRPELEVALNCALREAETDIEDALRGFIPNLRKVTIDSIFRDLAPTTGRGLFSVQIDDGAQTAIAQKGDGVQSLVTLALMRSNDSAKSEKASIFAIEEPEAHLHPEVVHRLRAEIEKRSSNSQIIIATHSPIFVQRDRISANILVQSSKAREATSIRELRDALGVKVPDNLTTARTVVICEGTQDANFLKRHFAETSPSLKSLIDSGEVIFVAADGAANIEYSSRLYIQMSCDVIVFADSDQEGKQVCERIQSLGLVASEKIFLATHSKRSNSELEDLYGTKAIAQMLKNNGLDPDADFEASRAPFSTRLKQLCARLGKACGQDYIRKLKNELSLLDYQLLRPDDGAVVAMLARLEKQISGATK